MIDHKLEEILINNLIPGKIELLKGFLKNNDLESDFTNLIMTSRESDELRQESVKLKDDLRAAESEIEDLEWQLDLAKDEVREKEKEIEDLKSKVAE